MKTVFNIIKEGVDLNKRIYQCAVCDKVFNWDENSSWYGSDKDMEEHPEKIKYFCSRECSNHYLSNQLNT